MRNRIGPESVNCGYMKVDHVNESSARGSRALVGSVPKFVHEASCWQVARVGPNGRGFIRTRLAMHANPRTAKQQPRAVVRGARNVSAGRRVGPDSFSECSALVLGILVNAHPLIAPSLDQDSPTHNRVDH